MEATPVAHNAEGYRGFALAQLRILSDYCKRYKLTIASRKVVLNNGVAITCSYCWGKQDVWVSIPAAISSRSVVETTLEVFVTTNHLGQSPDYVTELHYVVKTGDDFEFIGPSYIPHGDRHFVDDGGNMYSWKWHPAQYKIPYAVEGCHDICLNGSAAVAGSESDFFIAFGTGPAAEIIMHASYATNQRGDMVFTPTANADGFVYKFTGYKPNLAGVREKYTASKSINLFDCFFADKDCNRIQAGHGGFIQVQFETAPEYSGDGTVIKDGILGIEYTPQPQIGSVSGSYSTLTNGFATTLAARFEYNELYTAYSKLVVSVLESTRSTNTGAGRDEYVYDIPVGAPNIVPSALTITADSFVGMGYRPSVGGGMGNYTITAAGVATVDHTGAINGFSCISGQLANVTFTVVDECGHSASVTTTAAAPSAGWVTVFTEHSPHPFVGVCGGSGWAYEVSGNVRRGYYRSGCGVPMVGGASCSFRCTYDGGWTYLTVRTEVPTLAWSDEWAYNIHEVVSSEPFGSCPPENSPCSLLDSFPRATYYVGEAVNAIVTQEWRCA